MPKLTKESTVQAKVDMIGCGSLFDASAIKKCEEKYFEQLTTEDKEISEKENDFYKKINGLE